MNTMLHLYRVLATIILTNLWPIGIYIELTIEKAQLMYVTTIDVPIDLATHFIDVIQKATTKKEVSLPFGGLISRVAIMAIVPLHDNEPIVKIYSKVSTITVVKSEVVISKKRSHPKKSTSSQPKTPQTSPLLSLIIEKL
jgi:hypothetical protein